MSVTNEMIQTMDLTLLTLRPDMIEMYTSEILDSLSRTTLVSLGKTARSG